MNKLQVNQIADKAGSITADKLQEVALSLSNGGWCRHWMNWPISNDFWAMAIQVKNEKGNSVYIVDMHDAFQRLEINGEYFYFVKRCNDDGSPYARPEL